MKVRQLIEELQKLDQELEVRVIADHGQCEMKANSVDKMYTEDLEEYMIEDSVDFKNLVSEFKPEEREGFKPFVSISAF